jgi:hypothetical protein
MAERRAATSWLSEHVIVAIVGAVGAFLVAVVGLIGVLGSSGGGDGDDGTDTPTPHPKQQPVILIRETAFTALEDGEVEIRVAGSVRDFPPTDRLYAIARPSVLPDPPLWWVSEEVAPTLAGEWTARILAAVEPGQELRVSAVRVEALDTEPGPGPSATGPTRQGIREQLATLGPDAPAAREESRPLPAFAPPAP